MKKLLFFLTLTAASLNLSAQNSIKNWEKTAILTGTNPVPATGYSWFTTSNNSNISCAYNPYNDKLYVTDRNNNIYIINASTGAEEGTLSKLGLTLNGFGFQRVRVTSTGEIYSPSLKTSTANGNTIVHYWAPPANANDPYGNPVQIGDPTTGIQLLSQRSADGFTLTGFGQNVVMYFAGAVATGSTGTNLEVVSKTGPAITDFTKVNTITLTGGGIGRSGIAPVSTGTTSDIWISGAAAQKRLITSTGVETKILSGTTLTAPGTYTPTVAGSISSKFSAIEYFEIGTKKFLAATGANDGSQYHPTAPTTPTGEGLALHIYDVTDFNAVKLVEATQLSSPPIGAGGFRQNANGTADIAIKRVLNGNGTTTVTFFQLITNNGLASHSLTFNTDGTLPVDLTSFTAAIKNSKNTLTWTTASESNNSGFDVESSTDGFGFNKIGFVATKAANGNSNAVLTYSFEDAKAAKGTTYYRLKQVDFNGDFKYSDVKFINNSLNNAVEFSVYPNPVTNVIRVGTTVQDLNGYQVDLYNTNGLKVKSLNLVDGNTIDVSDLSSAIYMLKVSKDKNLVQTLKLVKQ